MEYIFLNGEIGWEATTTTLENDWRKLKGKDVTIYVNTVGGFAFEGVAIYDYIKLKLKEGYNIHTVATGVTASAGTLPFLAAPKSKRKATEGVTFLIHEASNIGFGNADDFEKNAEELKALNNKLANIYEVETNLTSEQALEIMKEDKSVDANWLLENGFISEIIKYEAVATGRNILNKNNKNKKEMKISSEDRSWFEQMFAKIGKSFVSPKNKIIQDANGVEIDFYELQDEDTEKVGDKAKVDDVDADGEYIVDVDGVAKVYVFVNGELTEIKDAPKPDNNQELINKIQELESENKELKDKLQNAMNEFNSFKKEIQSKFEYDVKDQNFTGKKNKTDFSKIVI